MHTNSSRKYLNNQRLFYRLLLKSFVKRHKKLIENIKRNTGSSYLSSAQATSILSWWKRIGKHLDSSIPIKTVRLGVTFEEAIIESILRLSEEADMTESMEIGLDSNRRKSSLSNSNSLLSKPGFDLSIDRDSLKIALQKACKRAIWSAGFCLVDEYLPSEYLAKLVQIVAAQYIHAKQSEKKLCGLTVSEVGEYLKSINRVDFENTVLRVISKSMESPDSPKATLSAAIQYIERETGDKLEEENIIAEMDTAYQNLLHYASQTMDNEFNSITVVSFDDTTLFSHACKKNADWIMEPVAAVSNLKKYRVYIPFSINPLEVISNESLGTTYITSPPNILSELLVDIPEIDWMNSAIEVIVLAQSHKHAHRNALNNIAILLDGIAILYPNGYVNYKYDIYRYVSECNGSMMYEQSIPKGFVHSLAGKKKTISSNIETLLKLRKSQYSWVNQLARCYRLIRKAAETQDQETRFLHLWRALETICGHLTGRHESASSYGKKTMTERIWNIFRKASKSEYVSSSRQMSPRNYLVFAASLPYNNRISGNGKQFWTKFDQQYTKIWNNLSDIMRVRSQWVIHTGSEHVNTLDGVSHEYLMTANEFIIEEIVYPSICYLTKIAIEYPKLRTRKEVYEKVFLKKMKI
jgi:hypothetical protein